VCRVGEKVGCCRADLRRLQLVCRRDDPEISEGQLTLMIEDGRPSSK
jgi:hypothetical protein